MYVTYKYAYIGIGVLKKSLLMGSWPKKSGDHWFKLPRRKYFGVCVFVGFFVLFPFPLENLLNSCITLKHWEQSILQFCVLVVQIYLRGCM